MLPMNFLKPGQTADYVNTGEWGVKAIKEAKRFGTIHVAASLGRREVLLYSQNAEPDARRAVRPYHHQQHHRRHGVADAARHRRGAAVADASSDIMARALDYSRFHLLYAGAQKNAGPAGVTLVIARKDYLERASDDIPAILSYKTHAKADSLYNTPPVFADLCRRAGAEVDRGAGRPDRHRERATARRPA